MCKATECLENQGRISAGQYVEGEEIFCFIYGEGVGDVDLGELIQFHKNQGKFATFISTQTSQN